jgi:hypothetical protein
MKKAILCGLGILALLAGCAQQVTQPSDSSASLSAYKGRAPELKKYNIQFEKGISESDVETASLAAIATPKIKNLPADLNNVNVYKHFEENQLTVTVGEWGSGFGVVLAKSNGVWKVMTIAPVVE